MGNAVAPAPPTSSGSPINAALSSTAELDPSTIPRPTISSSPTVMDSSSSPSSPPPPPPYSKQTNFTDGQQAVDLSERLSTEGMTAQQRLFYAAANGDCALIRRAVEDGADVNANDLGLKVQEEERRQQEEKEGSGRTAAKRQKANKEKADEVYKDLIVTRDTALHKAAAKGHLQAVDLLFHLEADLEAKDVLGSTALHRAVSAKQFAVVKSLLSKGSRVDAVNAIGNSPLHIASYQGDVDMAHLLLSHDRHENWKLVITVNHGGMSPIDYARKKAMHALLSSHGVAPSRTSSLIEHHPLHHGETPNAATPNYDHKLSPYESSGLDGEERPALSRAGSGGKGVGSRRGSGIPIHPIGHHHHHAPNPPISNPTARLHRLGSSDQPVASVLAPLVPNSASSAVSSSASSLTSSSAVLPTSSSHSSHSHSALVRKPSLDKPPSLDLPPMRTSSALSCDSQTAAVAGGDEDHWRGRTISTGGLSVNIVSNEGEAQEAQDKQR